MKVRLTASAAADIETFADQIAETDPQRARITIRAIKAAARSIGAAPERGSPVSSSPGVRKKLVPPFVLLYAIAATDVVILRIAHRRSDWVPLA